MTEYTKENHWYGWNGGECPVHPKTQVDVVFSNPSLKPFYSHPAHNVFWEAGDGRSDIIAFRITELHREPREFWLAASPYVPKNFTVVDSHHPHGFKVREVLE